MKKKNIIIIILITILTIGAGAAYLFKNYDFKNKKETNSDIFAMIEKEKTDYIGDATKVSHIVNLLKLPTKNIKQNFIKLNTKGDANELNIYYEASKNYEIEKVPYDNVNKEIYEKNSLILFYGIKNLNKINYYYRKNPSEGELILKNYMLITSISKEDMMDKYDDFEIIVNDLEKLKETITN